MFKRPSDAELLVRAKSIARQHGFFIVTRPETCYLLYRGLTKDSLSVFHRNEYIGSRKHVVGIWYLVCKVTGHKEK